MSTSTYTEASNAQSNITSPEINGCTKLEEKLVDIQAKMKNQKNSFTKVVINCQEKSKKCVRELDELKEKLKNTEKCESELEIQDKVMRDKDIEIDNLNIIIEDFKNKYPDSENNKGGKGDVISRVLTFNDLKPEKC